jgi:hypothetical protein
MTELTRRKISLAKATHKHLNTEKGFVKNQDLTNKFINESLNKSDFNFWWRKSLGVWEIKN